MHKERLDLAEVLQACLDSGEEGLTTSWDEVNAPMIRHWAQAMGDKNPIYTDAEFAAGTRHAALVAPPTMLQAWTMRGLQGPAPGSSTTDPMASVNSAIEDAGYGAVVATNCEQVYLRYITPGEKLHCKTRLESISPEKKTGLGTGFFVTQLLEYFTEEGEKVAEMHFTILRYKPAKREPEKEQQQGQQQGHPSRARPGMARDTMTTQEFGGAFFDAVSLGDQLPPLEIDITTLMIVSTAIASRDYQDVHHDKDRAQELGSPDIFMNILTSNGLVGRYVTDWAGPEAILTAVKIRLGAPNYPGDKMVLSGEVTDKRESDGRYLVDLTVAGNNRIGVHVSGTVTVDLLKSAPGK